MCQDTLDKIAQEVGEITEDQDKDQAEPDEEEGEHFDPEEYRRNKNEYDGGW